MEFKEKNKFLWVKMEKKERRNRRRVIGWLKVGR
jgi:hypothetical protein